MKSIRLVCPSHALGLMTAGLLPLGMTMAAGGCRVQQQLPWTTGPSELL